MDYYDSAYPLDYYTVGAKYLFYRDVSNQNFWVPQNKNEQKVYNKYVAKYLSAFETASTKTIGETEDDTALSPGITENLSNDRGVSVTGSPNKADDTALSPGITEKLSNSRSIGVTESSNKAVKADSEGRLVNYKNINKEIGVVIGKYDGNYQAISVLFDDGKVVDYIAGQPSFLSQKNPPVMSFKERATVPSTKRNLPVGLRGLTEVEKSIKSAESAAEKGHNETTVQRGKQQKGVTETSEEGTTGVTELQKEDQRQGITEVPSAVESDK